MAEDADGRRASVSRERPVYVSGSDELLRTDDAVSRAAAAAGS